QTGNVFPARLRVGHQDRTLNTNYRRNGKLQSCEPCRKGKLRCDHMMPTCGRCARRNRPEQCVYHPAPLTKNSLPSPPTENSSTASSVVLPSPEYVWSGSSHTIELLSMRGIPSHTSYIHRRKTTSVSQVRFARASSLPAQPLSTLNYGYQTVEELRRPLPEAHVRGDSVHQTHSAGFIHHTAILAEHETSIGILPSADTMPQSPVSQSYIERGAALLTLLKELPTFRRYIDKWFSFARGILLCEPMVKIFTSGLWKAWAKRLAEQNPSELRVMSEQIWQNTLKPVSRLLNRNTTPREFCAAVTGEGLRWEVVGIIVTLVSLLAGSLSDGDPIFCSHDDAPVDRAALTLRTHNAAEICLSFCDDFSVLNDLYLWLLYEHTIVYCCLRTRGSFENWRKTGTLTSAILYCNLHEEITVNDNTPLFIAEMRKRLFLCVYENDKYSAVYHGRPPRLTRQYCLLQLPLDLDDHQMMLEGDELEAAVAALDSEGWNKRKLVGRCTFSRIFVTNSLITESILEISMGSLSQDEIVHRAAEIEQQAIEAWNDMPDFLRLDNQPFSELKRPPIEFLYLTYIRVDDYYHHFLLQRTLIKKVGTDSKKLFVISKEMFKFFLFLINHRDIFKDFQIDFSQLLTMGGIPSAAVIAVELLHQEQNPASFSALNDPLPRSDTIQDLSVFVACLGTIKPGTNGYAASARGRKFLKKILDTILDPASMRVVGSEGADLADPSFTSPLFQTGNDGDFMRWLETMELEQESWANFN
ncbi:hypothetical protein K458DRAFT_314916, partial [Lentithecium fluviatile CBS 122367]